MKREKISLFILVVEIAVIVFLHSAKNDTSGTGDHITKSKTVATSYQLSAGVPVTTIK